MTTPPDLPLPDAERLAERTLAAMAADDQAFIDRFGHKPPWESPREKHRRIDRERVASDLAGLRQHQDGEPLCRYCWEAQYESPHPCPDARRYSDGLRRTAELYGILRPTTTNSAPPAQPMRGAGGAQSWWFGRG